MSKLPRSSEETIDERFTRMIDERFATLMMRVQSGPRVYTQHDRPAWAPTKTLFLAAWRELREAGHHGVRAVGKVRTMTEAAAEVYATTHAPKLRPIPPPPESGTRDQADVLAELGARPKGRAR